MGALIIVIGSSIYSLFCWWVVFGDGAEVIQGWRSVIFFGLWAGRFDADQLRLYVAASWLVAAVMLGIHLLSR